jgi:hypothetical protein
LAWVFNFVEAMGVEDGDEWVMVGDYPEMW